MTDKKLKCLGNKLDMALIKASDELVDPTEQLAKRAANGDRAAFSQLIDLQYDFIFSVAFKWLGHRDDAQDVAQDVAIKLARNISGFDGRAKFTTWLYRVILNTVRDFQKAAARPIDTAMTYGAHHPMGPLELADFIGLDTCLAIMQKLYEGLSDPKYRPCPLLVKYVEAGWLGRKAGRGFYDYRDGKPVPTR